MKTIILTVLITLVFTFIIRMIPVFKQELQLLRVYSKCDQIQNGMLIFDVHKVLDTDFLPIKKIEFNPEDSSYRHIISFPPTFFREDYLVVEYDPYTKKVVNFVSDPCK